jgi:hypothetical protein
MTSTGMLWFHPHNDTAFEKRLQQAVNEYQQLYGVLPSLCYANPQELSNRRRRSNPRLKRTLSPNEQLAPGQFWLGQR